MKSLEGKVAIITGQPLDLERELQRPMLNTARRCALSTYYQKSKKR